MYNTVHAYFLISINSLFDITGADYSLHSHSVIITDEWTDELNKKLRLSNAQAFVTKDRFPLVQSVRLNLALCDRTGAVRPSGSRVEAVSG